MPIARCTKDGKPGWKAWAGDSICYIGRRAKQLARRRLKAIKTQQANEARKINE